MNWLTFNLVNLSFSIDMLMLFLQTDEFRKGNEVITAKTKTQICPVGMLEKYMEKGKIPKDTF